MTTSQDLAGRSFLVTGANTGIGRVTAMTLAARGATVTLAGRSEERTRPVLDEIAAAGGKASFLPLDLGDLASVARAARTFLDSGAPLEVLVNNAGIAGPRGLTADGFEITWGTNHLGPFLFTRMLLPLLRKATGARVVNVASGMHFRAKGIDWDALRRPTRSITAIPEYAVSKLCNILFTKQLARGEAGPEVHSYTLHPGGVASDIYRRIPWPFEAILKLFLISNEEGAKTSLHCAASPAVAADNGLYYDECAPRNPSKLAQDEGLARTLWDVSEEAVAPFLR
jgi:NAD(P)-dependent dehydrogenase (short-subunit alcohol dehydrogenase family)